MTWWLLSTQVCLSNHHYSSASAMRYLLQWRHNGRGGVSNHQPRDCLLSCLIRRRSKKTSKLRVTGLCAGTGEMASKAEYVSIWWRHHGHHISITGTRHERSVVSNPVTSTVFSTTCSVSQQRKRQSSALLVLFEVYPPVTGRFPQQGE